MRESKDAQKRYQADDRSTAPHAHPPPISLGIYVSPRGAGEAAAAHRCSPQTLAKEQLSLDGGARLVEQVLLLRKTTRCFPLPSQSFPSGSQKEREMQVSFTRGPVSSGDNRSGEGHGPSKASPPPHQGIETSERRGFSLLVPTTLKGTSVMDEDKGRS